MIEFFYSIDVFLFFFINQTIANPVFDWIMPVVTDLNHILAARIAVIVTLGVVLWKGGFKGRITVGLLFVTIIISDQLNSAFLKEVFGRIRPCRALDGVRLLVDCGGGLSFPSSHAVNNFAGATVISYFYKKQSIYWFLFAFIVAFSRTYVGVHYPSDIVAGGLIGITIGYIITGLYEKIFQIYRSKNTHQ